MSLVAMVNTTCLPKRCLMASAVMAEPARTERPGLYATDRKSASSKRAPSRSAGSGPRGGEKSQMNAGLPWPVHSVTRVTARP